jgi:nicotinate-nucleotide adenylyltransferase
VTAGPRAVVLGRLGILGGTFDPIHIGHLAAAEEAREALGLERILFVPAGRPWQKADRPVSEARHRLAMVELAITGNPAFGASSLELERDGPTYAVDTLTTLAGEAVDAGRSPDLWFILSTEALAGLPTWHEPERLLELARLAVVPRDGETAIADAGWFAERFTDRADQAVFLDGPHLRVSATELRARVAAGRSIRYLVPDAVTVYIGDHGLYRDPQGRAEGR